jgi:hypothetical protein
MIWLAILSAILLKFYDGNKVRIASCRENISKSDAAYRLQNQ